MCRLLLQLTTDCCNLLSLPVCAGGGDANLPSVLRDNPAVMQQWKAFLLSLLMDCSSSSSASAASGSNDSRRRLSIQQATAAAVFLLLQDRFDDAEEVLTAIGCWDLGQPGAVGQVPVGAAGQDVSGALSMQVGV
jgi:hypothetical protein